MKKLKQIIACMLIGIILAISFCSDEVKAAKNVVIVIDPGHGGTNLGTDYLTIPEKTYNLIIASFMKQELENYDNVTVYLTRGDDSEHSLEERAEFAKSVNADFLFSLHLNQSADHTLYGSEVWIPSKGAMYAQSYSFANEMVQEFSKLGLFNRGIKTKVTKKNNDYYGILRNCSARNIPSAIIEHCHVDHPIDASYYASTESLQKLGIADATAVARYFGLKSSKTGKDYSQYMPLAVPVPNIVYQDTTAPEVANIALVSVDQGKSTANLLITASDSNGIVQSYRYSLDWGVTWSVLYPWQITAPAMQVSIPLPKNTCQVLVEVFNQYDLKKQSNLLTVTK